MVCYFMIHSCNDLLTLKWNTFSIVAIKNLKLFATLEGHFSKDTVIIVSDKNQIKIFKNKISTEERATQESVMRQKIHI